MNAGIGPRSSAAVSTRPPCFRVSDVRLGATGDQRFGRG